MKTCTNKKGYRSSTDVLTVGRIETRLRNKKLWYYPCNKCHKWHFTHNKEVFDVIKYQVK